MRKATLTKSSLLMLSSVNINTKKTTNGNVRPFDGEVKK